MGDSTEITTPLKSTKSRNSNPSVQIQIKPKTQFEFAPRDTKTSEFVDLVDFGGVAILVENAIRSTCVNKSCAMWGGPWQESSISCTIAVLIYIAPLLYKHILHNRSTHIFCTIAVLMYLSQLRYHSLLHLECHSISISNLDLFGRFSTYQRPRELDLQLRIENEEMTL